MAIFIKLKRQYITTLKQKEKHLPKTVLLLVYKRIITLYPSVTTIGPQISLNSQIQGITSKDA
jgi:hypothetical protein